MQALASMVPGTGIGPPRSWQTNDSQPNSEPEMGILLVQGAQRKPDGSGARTSIARKSPHP